MYAAKSLQSCPTLCDSRDDSPPGSSVPGILQARTLEWVAISFSDAWKWKVKVKSLSRVRLLATTWTAAHQAPPSIGFSRQEYWSGVPLPSPILMYSMIYIHLCIYHPMKLFQSRYGILLSLPKVPSCLFIIHIHPDTSNCCSLFCHYSFLLRGHIKGIMKYLFVGVWLLDSACFLNPPSVRQHTRFLLSSSLLLCGCTICLPIHLLIDIWVVPSFRLLWTKLLWIFMYSCLCVDKCFHFLLVFT